MSGALLHVAAFWVEGDKGDEIADLLAEMKIEGTQGAVVTFSERVALDTRFEVNGRALSARAPSH